MDGEKIDGKADIASRDVRGFLLREKFYHGGTEERGAHGERQRME
jgi:hypothetical protein